MIKNPENNYSVVKVKHKKTKEEIYIKTHMFNSELHERIPGETPMSRLQYRATILKDEYAQKLLNALHILDVFAGKTAKKEVKERQSEELPTNIFKLRKWAKEKGMKVDNKTKKQEILDWAKEKGFIS